MLLSSIPTGVVIHVPVQAGIARPANFVRDLETAPGKISFTPMFFVKGNQLPYIYNVADLKYFLSV